MESEMEVRLLWSQICSGGCMKTMALGRHRRLSVLLFSSRKPQSWTANRTEFDKSLHSLDKFSCANKKNKTIKIRHVWPTMAKHPMLVCHVTFKVTIVSGWINCPKHFWVGEKKCWRMIQRFKLPSDRVYWRIEFDHIMAGGWEHGRVGSWDSPLARGIISGNSSPPSPPPPPTSPTGSLFSQQDIQICTGTHKLWTILDQ